MMSTSTGKIRIMNSIEMLIWSLIFFFRSASSTDPAIGIRYNPSPSRFQETWGVDLETVLDHTNPLFEGLDVPGLCHVALPQRCECPSLPEGTWRCCQVNSSRSEKPQGGC